MKSTRTARPGLLISTVPAGAADGYAGRMLRAGGAPIAVLDAVYHPWPTRLAAAAAAAGAVTVSGFELLLHQAGPQVQLMTGRPRRSRRCGRRASPNSRAGLRRSRRAAEYHQRPRCVSLM